MNAVEREMRGEIMKTDVYVKIVSEHFPSAELETDLDTCFMMFRDFEARFSRFQEGNELARLNASEESVVSLELFDLLSQSRTFYEETSGRFDPSILPMLIREGYGASFGSIGFGVPGAVSGKTSSFDTVSLDAKTLTVRKPESMKIDLGGIGKGYIVDRVADVLGKKYRDFVVDAGGDMYCAGRDVERDLRAWAIGVEDPMDLSRSLAMVALSDHAVATSGINRRKWAVDQSEKSHLIDPMSGKSVVGDIVSVTTIANTTLSADIYAKTLLLMGIERGMIFAKQKNLAVMFVEKSGGIKKNDLFETMLWKNV